MRYNVRHGLAKTTCCQFTIKQLHTLFIVLLAQQMIVLHATVYLLTIFEKYFFIWAFGFSLLVMAF